jgi:hypothetical protein
MRKVESALSRMHRVPAGVIFLQLVGSPWPGRSGERTRNRTASGCQSHSAARKIKVSEGFFPITAKTRTDRASVCGEFPFAVDDLKVHLRQASGPLPE